MRDLKAAFRRQRYTAKQREIPFLLTFEEWLSIWKSSGKLKLRGRKKGCYVMARLNDCGPYAKSNVEIIKQEVNASDGYRDFKPRKPNSSGCRGVSWQKEPRGTSKWRVRVWRQGKRICLGYFNDLDKAIAVRQAAS